VHLGHFLVGQPEVWSFWRSRRRWKRMRSLGGEFIRRQTWPDYLAWWAARVRGRLLTPAVGVVVVSGDHD
jgi:hypothetical protein